MALLGLDGDIGGRNVRRAAVVEGQDHFDDWESDTEGGRVSQQYRRMCDTWICDRGMKGGGKEFEM